MKEEDIRPKKIFDEYLKLAEKDVETYFMNVPFHYVSCPACNEKKGLFQFRKFGFDYEECQNKYERRYNSKISKRISG